MEEASSDFNKRRIYKEMVDTTISELPHDKDFHLFICCASDSIEEVRTIVRNLEEYGIKCCYYERDFIPGQSIALAIHSAIQRSVGMLIVLSEGFLSSKYCEFEVNNALHRHITEGYTVIPIKIEPCAVPNYIQHISHIDASEDDIGQVHLRIIESIAAKGKNAGTQPDNTDFGGKPSIPENSENNRGKVKGTTALSATDQSLAEKKNSKSYRAPKDVCMYDGRLLKLGETDRKTLKSECKEENVIGSGGFGKVYASKTSIPGFDMRVAIKRVCAEGEHLEKAVKREMNASRILHPFILPLLAVFNEGHKRHTDYYIVSPYCENNSLRMVIDKNPEKLSQFQRIRIGLQLALAIEYLHTPVTNVRKAILHKDISSKNVVLDVNMNVRLMDFGLAREEDDCTSTGAGTEGYRHPKKGDGLSNMALLDYYAFGVVLRELLTHIKPTGITEELIGLAAPEKFRNKHLCNIESDDILKYLDYKKLKWWPMDDDNTKDSAKVVNDVAARCLKATEVRWPTVIGQLKNIVREEVKDLKLVEKQCEVCMINSKGKSIQLYHSNCRRNMAVCVACEKNSFFNPITCLTCGESIQPIIGKDWGALLVAGDGIQSDVDQRSKDIEGRVFKDDVTDIKRVITSRAPLIMGISPENVEEVLQDNILLLPRLKDAFKRLQNLEKITKLFIYISCHGSNTNDNQFIFGSETLSLAEFQTLLDMLSNIKTFVIILDRCFPPEIRLKNAENVLQFNASKSSQASVYQKSSGSLFTRFFIQALKGKSENVKCLLKTGSHNEECCLCSKFRSDEKDYLSVQSVFTYVRDHMENEKATPQIFVKGDLGYLGYFTDEEVRIEFTHELQDGQVKLIQLESKFFRTIEEVKTELLNQCKGVLANANSTVEIEMDTCRQDNPREVCNSIEMVMSAWAYRKPLYVKFYTSPL